MKHANNSPLSRMNDASRFGLRGLGLALALSLLPALGAARPLGDGYSSTPTDPVYGSNLPRELQIELTTDTSGDTFLRLTNGKPGETGILVFGTVFEDGHVQITGQSNQTTFDDARSCLFAVDLETLVGERPFYAQGLQMGPCGVQVSPGLSIERTEEPVDGGPGGNGDFSETPFSPPPNRIGDVMANFPDGDFEAMLRDALNSTDDTVEIGFGGSGSVSVYGVQIGMGSAFKLKAEKRDGRFYLSPANDFALTVGASLLEGKRDLNIKSGYSIGYGGSYRFDSVEDLAAGIRYYALAATFPVEAAFGGEAPSLLALLQHLNTHRDNLEHIRGVMEAIPAPFRDATLWEQLNSNFPAVAGQIEEVRRMAEEAMDNIETLRNQVATGMDFLDDHFFAFEIHGAKFTEGKLDLDISAMLDVADVPLIGDIHFVAGGKTSIPVKIQVEFEGYEPSRVVLTVGAKAQSAVKLGEVLGGEWAASAMVEVKGVFEFGDDYYTRQAGNSDPWNWTVSLKTDKCLESTDKLGIEITNGVDSSDTTRKKRSADFGESAFCTVGRSISVEVPYSPSQSPIDLPALFAGDPSSITDLLAETSVKIQDRYEFGCKTSVGGKVAGTGMKLEASLRWSDRGPKTEHGPMPLGDAFAAAVQAQFGLFDLPLAIVDVRDEADAAVTALQYRMLEMFFPGLPGALEQAQKMQDELLAMAADFIDDLEARLGGLDAEIEDLKATIEAQRAQLSQALAQASHNVTQAQAEVNSIQYAINAHWSRINQLKAQIKSWRNWYNAQPWYNKTWAWSRYLVEAGWRQSEINTRMALIVGLEASKLVAQTALQVAQVALQELEAAVETYPVDQDPRIIALQLGRDAAAAMLELARQALTVVPPIPQI